MARSVSVRGIPAVLAAHSAFAALAAVAALGAGLLVACGGGGSSSSGGASPEGGAGAGDGGPLSAGRVLASEQISGLALDDANVYFRTNGNAYAIESVPKSGGEPKTIATGTSLLLGSLAVDDASVYFGDQAYQQTPSAVRAAPKAGGAAHVVLDDHVANRIAVDGDSLVLLEENAVYRVAKAGGTPAKISEASCTGSLALDASAVYCVSFSNAAIVRIAKDGSETKTLFTPTVPAGHTPLATSLASVGGKIYYGTRVVQLGAAATCAIHAVDATSGAGVQISTECANELAGDASGLYLVATSAADPLGPKTLAKMPLDGGPLTPMATIKDSGPIVVDATTVFYAGRDASGWHVLAVPKP